MRNRYLGLGLLISMFVLSSAFETHASQWDTPKYNSWWGGIGSGGAWTLGVRGKNLGIAMGGTGEAQMSEDQILDWAVPHDDYTSLGRKSTSSAWGIDLLGFVNPLKWCSIQMGLGVYSQDFRDVAQSNVTGWTYTQGKSSETQMAYSAGLQFLPFNKLTFGVDYHSVRGVTGVIGLKFD
ncbi:MAG: hypothetical protein A3I06_00855 [Candidatus Lindowbacteria bacterium RIFCSPLOWO2_02_FULL_62_12]|nr:MAG: hypothetical protein A3I06_00855 [Candidatus Lindowbacteria bacterium RIFCSPLOWO2_02_FULL_62_12]